MASTIKKILPQLPGQLFFNDNLEIGEIGKVEEKKEKNIIKTEKPANEKHSKSCIYVFINKGKEVKFKFLGYTFTKDNTRRVILYNVDKDITTTMTETFFNFWLKYKLKEKIFC